METLRGRVSDLRVDMDPVTGSPKFIGSPRGFLTGPAGVGLGVAAGAVKGIPVNDPHRAVKAFLNEHRDLFGHGAEALVGARTKRDYVASHNGMRTSVWEQELDGVRIFEAVLQAHITARGELVSIGSHFVADPAAAADKGTPDRAARLAAPIISAAEAVAIAAHTIGEALTAQAVTEVDQPQGPEKRQQFRAAPLNDITAQLVWLPTDESTLRLCWEIILASKARGEMFRVLVDAETGDPQVRQGLTNYLSDASYRVYTSDSPSPMSPGLATPTSTQPATVSRVLVTTPALNTTASPNGWIDDGVNETRGNNVDAHTDTNADNIADTPRPQGTNRVFDFPMDLTQAPSTYKDAAVTQLFYWCNWMHDKLYALGFTEAAGNFQNNNFGRGGLGNDAVQADAQDGSGTNNANFSTPGDGSAGRMQMYVFDGPTPDRDGDFDAEIVLHEYAHGLSNRLVGGGVGISALQPRGMGEGWSDFYGMSLLSEVGDDVNGNYAAGGYATYQLSGLTSNYYYGIRRYPYTTDMTKNPLTFKDIDPAQASAHTGVPRSPIIGTTANEVHNMGEVWCVTLWEARANLIGKYGAAAGNQLILQLVTDGMKLAPANPNFLQARDAIILADMVNNGGANKNQLWAAFAKRGMGASAASPASSTTTGVIEAFDLPDDLSVSPLTSLSASGDIGGPFTPSSTTYTLTNNGTAAVNWTASKSQNWITLSGTSGTLAPGASTSVVVSINAAATSLSAGTYTDTIVFRNSATAVQLPRTATLTISPPRLSYFPLDTDPGWGRTGQWAFGKPSGGGGTSHGGPDPSNGATGTNVFGVNLAGDYSTTVGGPYYLTAGPINLSGATGTRLQFQRWLNSDFQPYVTQSVEVSNNGSTWTQIWSNGSGEMTATTWTKVQYDISTVADRSSTVYIRWGYSVASGAWAYSGWNIDDVEILGSPITSLGLSVPASASEGDLPLTGTVSVSSAPASNLVITLTSSNPSKLSVPATVTILAGQTKATFAMNVVNNTLLDGTKTVVVTASAASYVSKNASIDIYDNETATLSLELPVSAIEGTTGLTGKVKVSRAVDSDVVVSLSSNDISAAQPQATTTILAGQTSATFSLTFADDTRIDGTQMATITAHVEHWTDGSGTIAVLDNESTNLALSIPVSAREGEGAVTGNVQISGTLATDLTVSLNSTNTGAATVPASVTIAAGQTSASFAIGIVDDTEVDGTQTATINAVAQGFTGTSAAIAVTDNEASSFVIAPISSPQVRGAAFTVSVTAKDLSGATITNYSGALNLSAKGDIGAIVITPPRVGGAAFVNGTWSGQITVNDFATNVILTAMDDGGHLGVSNAFDVGVGGVDHFSWSNVPSPQMVDTPIPVTISALDAGNNIAKGFKGAANLSVATAVAGAQIGTGTSTWYMPFYGYYAKARTQVIYLASELGGAGRIAGLSLYVGTSTTSSFSNWTLRLKQTTQSSYASASWDASGWTTVYQATATPSATGWVTFTFTSPFDYDGVSNLLVDYSFNSETVSNSIAYCRYSSVGSSRAIYGYSMTGDPLTWSGTTGATPFSSTSVPNIQLNLLKSVAIRPATANFSNGTWTGAISMPFTSNSAAVSANDGAGHSGVSNAFQVVAPTTGAGGAGMTIFSEDFESGNLSSAWGVTGTATFRTQVTSANGAHGGSYHLTMDSSSDGNYSRNEATATLNLLNRSGVVLKFWAKSFSEEPDGPPTSPFIGGADFDGVAISADGNTWWEVQPLRSLSSSYVQYTVDLDAAIAARGISYTSGFKIRFNQYDNYGISTDGIAIDDIVVTANPVSTLSIGLPTQVNENDGEGVGTVTLPAVRGTNTVVNFTSSSPGKLAVSAGTIIPAGALSAQFKFTVLDDTILDGSRTVLVTAATAGLTNQTASVLVVDNEKGVLGISVPSPVAETAGSVQGTLTLSSAVSGPVTVTLVSSDTTAAQVPASVTFAPGQTSATFTITVVDDTKIDGTQNATITASVTGWTPASAQIGVTDNETTILTTYGSSLTEGSSTYGFVYLSGTLSTPLVVSLASSNTSRLTVPALVTIPAGATSASFLVAGVNNSLTDGTASVTVTASASGFTSGTASWTVYDNDVHHFSISSISTSQIRNVPFSVTISALDVNGTLISSYAGPATLSATVPITPTATGTFSGGIWTGNITPTSLGTNASITVSDGLGHTGTSNTFNVGVGALDHFTWSAIASPQTAGVPFTGTVTAQDIGNNTLTSYGGTAALTCGPAPRVIGAGTLSQATPLETFFHDERTQVIYPASEVGGAGQINSLSLYVTTVPGQTLNAWTIRMKHTSLASYSSGASWDGTGWSTVYQSNTTISQTGWVTFVFSTPFQYDGISNLMVDFSFNNASFTSSAQVRYTTASATRVLYYYTDSGYGDPLSWGTTGITSPSPYTSSSVPDLRLGIGGTIGVIPSSASFTNGIWSGSINLGQSGTGVLMTATSGSVQGVSNTFNVQATLGVSPSTGLTATGSRGGPFTPSSLSWTITNGSAGAILWTAAKTANWITLSTTGGTLAPGGSATITATINANANPLVAGTYSDTVTFTNITNGVGTTTRPITLSISAGVLSVTPDILVNLTSAYGEVAAIERQVFTITNTSDKPVAWSAASSASWLTLSADSGTLEAGASVTLTASVSSADLAVNSYRSTVTFGDLTNESPAILREVLLSVVLPAPVLSTKAVFTGGDSSTVSWSSVSGATLYEVQCARRDDFSDAISSGWIAGTSFTFQGLADGVLYYYRVRAQQALVSDPSSQSALRVGENHFDKSPSRSGTQSIGKVTSRSVDKSKAATLVSEAPVEDALLGSAWSEKIASTQDAEAPSVDIVSPTVVLQSSISLQGLANDLSGVTSLSINGVSAISADKFRNWNSDLLTLVPGMNTISIVATDGATPPNLRQFTISLFYATATHDQDGDGLPDAWEFTHGLDLFDQTGANGALGELNGGGVSNLMRYALNIEGSADPRAMPWCEVSTDPSDGSRYITYHYRRRVDWESVGYVIEVSNDLSTWSPAESEEVQRTPDPDGVTENVAARIKPAVGSLGLKSYVRLRVFVP